MITRKVHQRKAPPVTPDRPLDGLRKGHVTRFRVPPARMPIDPTNPATTNRRG